MNKNFSDVDRAIIKEIEADIPLNSDPYGTIARKAGCSREEVLARLLEMKRNARLRRIGAVLHHRESGYKANGMLVCRVPECKIEPFGMKLASFNGVSHCYQRKSYPNWPYNLYAMIHGKCREDVEGVVERFTNETGVEDYRVLYSTEEIKKTSVKYSLLSCR